MEIKEIEFDEELYLKNLAENEFFIAFNTFFMK